MKHDDKMTGEYVHNVYLLLYFKGVNFVDIIQAMYLLCIILGVLSFALSLVGLSDVFIALRTEWKTKYVSNKHNYLKYFYLSVCISEFFLDDLFLNFFFYSLLVVY